MDIKYCKSYAEIGRLLGFSYYNGSVKKAIVKYCKDNGLNAEEIIANNNKPNICLFCGKEIEGKSRFVKKFCNSSCAAKYNNKGRSCGEKTKQKISQTLKGKYQNGILKPHNLGKNTIDNCAKKQKKPQKNNKNITAITIKLSDLINNGLVLNPYNVPYKDGHVYPSKYKERVCVICGNKFRPSLTKNGNISVSNTCSFDCHKQLVSKKSSESMEKNISEGRHQGWKSRNIISYPEKFWADVLDNNHIVYEREKYVFNKYFLDFVIEKNGVKIDLEIDGKQHLYEERQKHDFERDKFLSEQGYVVYRIPWNEINSEKGKETMKNKINDFLLFFNNF